MWRYQVFPRKFTWYFIGVYIINVHYFCTFTCIVHNYWCDVFFLTSITCTCMRENYYFQLVLPFILFICFLFSYFLFTDFIGDNYCIVAHLDSGQHSLKLFENLMNCCCEFWQLLLQGHSKIIGERDGGTFIFWEKPLTDNNVKVKSWWFGNFGINFFHAGDPRFSLQLLRWDFLIFGAGGEGQFPRLPLWSHHWLNRGLHGQVPRYLFLPYWVHFVNKLLIYCIPFSCGSCHVTWWFFRWNCAFSSHRRIRHWKESYSGKWTPNILRGMKSCQGIVFSFCLYLKSFEI